MTVAPNDVDSGDLGAMTAGIMSATGRNVVSVGAEMRRRVLGHPVVELHLVVLVLAMVNTIPALVQTMTKLHSTSAFRAGAAGGYLLVYIAWLAALWLGRYTITLDALGIAGVAILAVVVPSDAGLVLYMGMLLRALRGDDGKRLAVFVGLVLLAFIGPILVSMGPRSLPAHIPDVIRAIVAAGVMVVVGRSVARNQTAAIRHRLLARAGNEFRVAGASGEIFDLLTTAVAEVVGTLPNAEITMSRELGEAPSVPGVARGHEVSHEFPVVIAGALGAVRVRTSADAIPESMIETVTALAAQASLALAAKAQEEQLRHRAFHDPLTDLPNRALFEDRLDHALAARSRGQGGLAVMFIDVDSFKGVNDSLGHASGDQVLRAMANLLTESLRSGDTAGRIGGDEFAILLDDADRDAAALVADRIFARLEVPMLVDGHQVRMSCSVGVVVDAERRSIAAELLSQADVAMYAAKTEGKGCYRIYEPGMSLRPAVTFDIAS